MESSEPDRRSSLPEAPVGSDDQAEYRPMPPKRSFEMTVTLEVRGRGKPLPYRLLDDVAE